MTPRQARRERREAERKAKKLELKKTRLAFVADRYIRPAHPQPLLSDSPEIGFVSQTPAVLTPPAASSNGFTRAAIPGSSRRRRDGDGARLTPETPIQPATEIGFVSQNNRSRTEINRANAQFSTGPTSPKGKVASSRNSLKHGLASGQLVIPGEDPAAFEALLQALLAEHQPATASEELLIKEMAQSHWIAQRAIRYQNNCLTAESVDQKQLALFLRYQTTHQRAFYKALDTLHKLKKARRNQQIGFASQQPSTAVPAIGFASQNELQSAPENGFVSQNQFIHRASPTALSTVQCDPAGL